jgi:hypothetical protein
VSALHRSLSLVSSHTHFAIATDDLASVVARLEEKHVPHSVFAGNTGKVHARADGARSVHVQDPDCCWIEINDTG